MHWYLDVWKKWLDFRGRARRTEYWDFFLLNMVIGAGGLLIAFAAKDRKGSLMYVLWTAYALCLLYTLAAIIPTLAVTVRRLHDTNRSGWWYFISFVPLVGTVILLVFLAQDGNAGENQYGPDPKAVAASPPNAPF